MCSPDCPGSNAVVPCAAAMFEPRLVWGIFCRLVGFGLLAQGIQAALQVRCFAGSRGLWPVAPVRQAIQRDFNFVQRFLFFPSLLDLNASDFMLVTLCLGVIFGSFFYILLGSWMFLLLAHVCQISLIQPLMLHWPWDSLLIETSTLLLASGSCQLEALQVQACHSPSNAVLLAFRWLLFRLMFGFGKVKFLDNKEIAKGDRLYLKCFVKIIPLPTPGSQQRGTTIECFGSEK